MSSRVDIEMPGPGSVRGASRDVQRKRFPDVRVIVLSAYVRDNYVDAGDRRGRVGLSVSKADDPEQHRRRDPQACANGDIRASARRSRGACRWRGSNARAQGRAGSKPQSRSNLLTTREQQILRMIGRGMSRTEIAKELFRSSEDESTRTSSRS